ncbi:hypothetical protein ACIQZB_25285 [Streptomyces sp. NPDC097727]|uniref:hypothetical protein n=1 Tax=Streptomyces sp. NPDC097727 TaxID=3366092 RepID=UPI0038147A43
MKKPRLPPRSCASSAHEAQPQEGLFGCLAQLLTVAARRAQHLEPDQDCAASGPLHEAAAHVTDDAGMNLHLATRSPDPKENERDLPALDTTVPDPAVIVFIGPAGSGTSTLASTWERAQVLSLGHCRALVSDSFCVKFSVLKGSTASRKL